MDDVDTPSFATLPESDVFKDFSRLRESDGEVAEMFEVKEATDAATNSQNQVAEPSRKKILASNLPVFPSIFRHVPRFWATAVENGCSAPLGVGDCNGTDGDLALQLQEPACVSLYEPGLREDVKGKWILLVSFPGLNAPYGTYSVKKIMSRASEFARLGCWIFFLSCDTYTKLREFRNRLEEKECHGKRPFDADNVTMLVDTPNNDEYTSEKLGVNVNFGESEHGDEKGKRHPRPSMCYPAYFLLTPDREVVQFCILKDPSRLCESTQNASFSYPMDDDVVDALLESLSTTLKPIYGLVERLKRSDKVVTFGDVIRNNIEEEAEEEAKSTKQPSGAVTTTVAATTTLGTSSMESGYTATVPQTETTSMAKKDKSEEVDKKTGGKIRSWAETANQVLGGTLK